MNNSTGYAGDGGNRHILLVDDNKYILLSSVESKRDQTFSEIEQELFGSIPDNREKENLSA